MTVEYQVMGYRVAMAQGGMGASDVVTLPAGWVPLGAVRQGETVLILCSQQVDTADLAITSLDPVSLPAGGTATTVDVYGSGFDPSCVVTLDDDEAATFFVDADHLQFTARADLASPGDTHGVMVVNSADQTSNTVTFSYT